MEKGFLMYLKIAQPKFDTQSNQRYHQYTIIKFLKLAIRMDNKIEQPKFLNLSIKILLI